MNAFVNGTHSAKCFAEATIVIASVKVSSIS